jgi:hypothetical protein
MAINGDHESLLRARVRPSTLMVMAINGNQGLSMAINGERKLACFAHAYAHPRCIELRLRRQQDLKVARLEDVDVRTCGERAPW